MKLIIIIPAKNEAETICQVISSVPKNIAGISSVGVIVIDDHSKDKTGEMAQAAGAIVIRNRQDSGLARSFARGLDIALSAGADIIVNTDADNQYDQAQIPDLIAPLIAGQADMVIGDRQVRNLGFMKIGNRFGNRIGSWVMRKLTGTRVQDASSGFRAISRETALNLNIRSKHTYTHESIIQAAAKNFIIAEVPITFKERQTGQSRLIKTLPTHIGHSLITITRTILMYKPLRSLLVMGAAIALPGFILCLRFLYYFMQDRQVGKVQSLLLATMLILIGFFTAVLGLLGDLMASNRRIIEDILYNQKKSLYHKHDGNN